MFHHLKDHLRSLRPTPHLKMMCLTALLSGLLLLIALAAAFVSKSALPLVTFNQSIADNLTCASTQGSITALCEKQDPIDQQCDVDAGSLLVQPVYYDHLQIGEVDLRYSPTCKTYWIRTWVYQRLIPHANGDRVLNVEANTTLLDGSQDNAENAVPASDGSVLIWTKMSIGRPRPASGVVDLAQRSSLTVPI